MISLNFGDCDTVHGERYCLNLYTLAEGCEATRILEIGCGWGFSAAAFSASLKNRPPAQIISIDPHLGRVLPSNENLVNQTGVEWRRISATSEQYQPDGEFDIVYIDGNPDEALNDARRFISHVRPGGYLVMDGYGGQYTPTSAAENMGLRFFTMFYSKAYAHAVHQIPSGLSLSSARVRITCDKCDAFEPFESDWKDEVVCAQNHISENGHGIVSRNLLTGVKSAWRAM